MTELAKELKLSKQAVSKQVLQYGLETRPGERRAKLVNKAEFIHAKSKKDDGYKAAAAQTVRNDGLTSGLKEEQTRKTALEVALKKLELAEAQGKVLPIRGEHGVERAVFRCADKAARAIGKLTDNAPDLASAFEADGIQGLRKRLRSLEKKIRLDVANAIGDIATTGRDAEQDGLIETDV